MLANQNILTPSDMPDIPVNSPSAEARAHGFWGGPLAKHDRPAPRSLVDVPSGKKCDLDLDFTNDKPIDDHLTHNRHEKVPRDKILIINDDGYNLAEGLTLRLKGGGDVENMSFSTPLATGKKRKVDNDNSSASSKSEEVHSQCIDDHCEAIEMVISDTKKIIEDMVKEGKVARRWAETLNHQLNELLIGSRRLGMAGSKILGGWSEQRVMLKESQQTIGDLHCDLGALREKRRALVTLHEDYKPNSNCIMSNPSAGTSGYLPSKTICPSSEFMVIDQNTIKAKSPITKGKRGKHFQLSSQS